MDRSRVVFGFDAASVAALTEDEGEALFSRAARSARRDEEVEVSATARVAAVLAEGEVDVLEADVSV